jgi:hypothetical protein
MKTAILARDLVLILTLATFCTHRSLACSCTAALFRSLAIAAI